MVSVALTEGHHVSPTGILLYRWRLAHARVVAEGTGAIVFSSNVVICLTHLLTRQSCVVKLLIQVLLGVSLTQQMVVVVEVDGLAWVLEQLPGVTYE